MTHIPLFLKFFYLPKLVKLRKSCDKSEVLNTRTKPMSSKHFSDEIVENDFAYFIVENYEQSCRNVKEVLKRRE